MRRPLQSNMKVEAATRGIASFMTVQLLRLADLARLVRNPGAYLQHGTKAFNASVDPT
jgi:hypothetical protein